MSMMTVLAGLVDAEALYSYTVSWHLSILVSLSSKDIDLVHQYNGGFFMPAKDTRLKLTVEHSDYGSVEAKLSKKGVKAITKTLKQPLFLILVALVLSLLGGKALMDNPNLIRDITSLLQIEKKGER